MAAIVPPWDTISPPVPLLSSSPRYRASLSATVCKVRSPVSGVRVSPGSEAVLGAVQGLGGRRRGEVEGRVVVREVQPAVAAAAVEAEELGLGVDRDVGAARVAP